MTTASKNPIPAQNPMAPLSRVGIKEPYEALMVVPRKYQDYSTKIDPSQLRHHIGGEVVLRLKILSTPSPDRSNPRFTFEALDEAGSRHKPMVFGALRFSPWKSVRAGDVVHVHTKVGEFNGWPQLKDPALLNPDQVDHVIPVYRSIPGRLAADKLATGVHAALEMPNALEDAVLAIRQEFDGKEDDDICALIGLKKWSLQKTLTMLHRPTSAKHAEWAQLAVRKLAIAAIQYKASKAGVRKFDKRSVIRIDPSMLRDMLTILPFQPTQGTLSQASAIDEVIHLLAEPYPMDILLSADVGVGKTLVYMLPAVAAQALGKRVVILIPNGLLVQQVAQEFRATFPGCPVFTLGDGGKSSDINWDSNPVLIGTTGINTVAKKRGWVPDLLIIDESQKTSRGQRDMLRAAHTNVLEATATAIPRTMALVAHGGKRLVQVSKHHADKTIHTHVVTPDHKAEMMKKVKEVIASGGQVAFIYPRVAGQESDDKKSVQDAGAMWEKLYPGRVAVLHGKLKDEEKMSVMDSVKSGAKTILIASTIIEVGMTVKNLRFLAIVHAERYGASTLHQMRGRLVRHGGEGWFYLYLPDPVEPETQERLQLLEKTNDGFRLAELDMDLRGFGNLADDSDDQAGASLTLFRDLRLMPGDFVETAPVGG